ncbi:MAG: hypothetical protein JO246_07645 [Frankiaceae bacterium]|nr:hypothetical protein [Frankiaceae bacterium]MBV9871069.1 hypothetical protein [Frankiaceae bacterium]
MTSLHVPLSARRVTPVSSSAWFVVAVPATVLSVVVSAIVWSMSGNSWIGLGAFAVSAAAGLTVAWRTGHNHLAPYAGGAAVTLVGLFVVPLVMAHYYIAQ